MPFFSRPPPLGARAAPYGSFHPGEGAAGRHDARFRTTCSLRKGFSSFTARVFKGTGLSWLLRSGALGMDFQSVGWLRSGSWGAVGEQRNPNTTSSGSWPPVRQCETTRDPNGVGLAELPGGFSAGGSGSPTPPPAGPSDNRKAGSIGGPEQAAIGPHQERKGLPLGVEVFAAPAAADRLGCAVCPLECGLDEPVGVPPGGRCGEPLDAALAEVQQPCNSLRREDLPEQFDGVGVRALVLPKLCARRPSFDPWANATDHRSKPERPPKATANPLMERISRRFHAQPWNRRQHPSCRRTSQRRPTAF